MDLGLKDKVIVVSGGGAGIGEAIVLELAQEGAIPVVADRSDEACGQLMEKLKKMTDRYLIISTNLIESEGCRKVADQAIDTYGKIDGLVNNAGINDKAGLENGLEAFRTSIECNLYHYYNLAHHCLPALKASKGAIVNIASKVAMTGQGGTSGYAASKGAQLALTREWAVELLPYGIRVNAILPAEVKTRMYMDWLSTFDDPEARLEQITSKIPLGKRMTLPEEIAATAVFLLSERSGHTTGQWLVVDGGYTHLDRSIS